MSYKSIEELNTDNLDQIISFQMNPLQVTLVSIIKALKDHDRQINKIR
jgi:hypothetical protein